ncbi:MAG: hypothetical protein ABR987_16645 [Terracidiphilus sp.]|jgi:hypothetical protein
MSGPISIRRSALIFWVVLAVASTIDLCAWWLWAQPGYAPHARIAFALLPIPMNLVLLAVIVRRIRQLDDFLRHVHLEAAAIAFLLSALAVFVYEGLEKAHCAGPLNAGIAWILMAVFYGIGYAISARHYR